MFLLSTHVALLGYVLIATLAGFSTPLLPIQILWMEFFIDISATVAFEREGHEPGSMTQPPLPRGQPLIDQALLVGIASRRIQCGRRAHARARGHGLGGACRLAGIHDPRCRQLVRANANRSLRTVSIGLGPNAVLLGMGVTWLVLQAAIPYIPPLAEAFRATPLSMTEWLLVAAVALGPAVVAEGNAPSRVAVGSLTTAAPSRRAGDGSVRRACGLSLRTIAGSRPMRPRWVSRNPDGSFSP